MKFLIFIAFISSYCAIAQSAEDCTHYIERWNYHLKSGQNLQSREVISRAKEFEKVIHEIKEANPPNWKDKANSFVERIKALDHHVVSQSLGEFSSSISDAFGGLVTRSDIFHGLQNNTPINKFPMTCINSFAEAYKVFISGQNSANEKILKRVTSFINKN
ncbi:unnamed protein product [Chironomus riparius]|uniref:Uncharacterized protein n=1 Tax=Chironomus riparius TaxID=315576 RepID=A0A9N9RTW0_9DIPT|nr:unnamed protein product [Chironomus riparius]